jgi:membrane fusion protein (multidrug efflux system)
LPLSYARIRSPIAGRVGKSNVTQGALVTKDQVEALTVVQQLDPVYVDVTQSASELLALRRLLEESDIRSVDPMTGSVDFRIVVPNPDRLLLPGMYVRAVVSNAVLQEGLLVPQQGIMRNPQGEAFAMVVNGENTVERRMVEVSRAIGNRWLVDDGLAAGDRVIVEGLQKVAPGVQVDPILIDGS